MFRALSVTALLAASLAAPAGAQSLKPDQVLSSVSVTPISAPNPVLGADGRVHLAYEILVVNTGGLFVTIDKVEATDPAGASLWSADGDKLKALTTMWSGEGERIAPGGSAAVFLDVSFAQEAPLPEELRATLTVTREVKGSDGKPAPLPATIPVPATVTFTGAPTKIGAPAVILDPPLRGDNWVAFDGCCDALTAHRGAVMAVNGRIRVPERFAIDWVRLDGDGKVFSGDGTRLEDFAYYGTEVHSVADGTVVNLYDGAEAQTPNAEPTGITTESIGGNMIVVDIGGGNFAFYAHMRKGSLRVKVGDTVRAGDVIGLLGNTGNTTAPHLHFHVMDGPSPLDANGLPYAFRVFRGQGVVSDPEAVEGGQAAVVVPRYDGAHEDALPLNNELVSFD